MERGALEAMERQFWMEGPDFYARSLAAEALMVFPEPVGTLTRACVLETVADAPRWRQVSFDQVRFVELGAEAVIMTYSARAERTGSPVYAALASSAYVRRGDHWLLAFHQQTPAPSRD